MAGTGTKDSKEWAPPVNGEWLGLSATAAWSGDGGEQLRLGLRFTTGGFAVNKWQPIVIRVLFACAVVQRWEHIVDRQPDADDE